MTGRRDGLLSFPPGRPTRTRPVFFPEPQSRVPQGERALSPPPERAELAIHRTLRYQKPVYPAQGRRCKSVAVPPL
jgi:hypothetical protein